MEPADPLWRSRAPMTVLITDLDNTLYDWVTFFATSFQGMVADLSLLLGVDSERLHDEFKVLHQRYGSSEQPFTALDLPAVKERFGDAPRHELMRLLDRPLHVFNSLRNKHLKLYDSVTETLEALQSAGIVLVGHTESTAENAVFRLQKLNVIKYFKHLYVLDSDYHGHPDPQRASALAPSPGLVRTVPCSERKPNPELLRDICRQEGVRSEDAYYVGDSLTRDISMAKAAGVTSVWAQYGTRYDRKLWNVLVRVTHWTAQDVAREERLRREFSQVEPDFTIESFSEILEILGLPLQQQRVPGVARAAS
jgi:phosphoglycolate phosphatase-like HAD superfamily hydrolase